MRTTASAAGPGGGSSPVAFTVGELATASGLTVRTLHHWDEIGLLPPAERSAAGHRRYSSVDVRRLYRIVALRGLGLSLDERRGGARDRRPGPARGGRHAPGPGRGGARAHARPPPPAAGHPRRVRPAGRTVDGPDLIAELDAERLAGTDVSDPRVQAMAARWQALIEAFTGGDPEIAASLKRMYAEEGPEKASRGAMNPKLMEYAGRAMAARG